MRGFAGHYGTSGYHGTEVTAGQWRTLLVEARRLVSKTTCVEEIMGQREILLGRSH